MSASAAASPRVFCHVECSKEQSVLPHGGFKIRNKYGEIVQTTVAYEIEEGECWVKEIPGDFIPKAWQGEEK
jgi:hypothetical protein